MVKREHMCAHGNCTETGNPLPIAVTVNLDVPTFKETQRFCCTDHAVAWMQHRTQRVDPRHGYSMSDIKGLVERLRGEADEWQKVWDGEEPQSKDEIGRNVGEEIAAKYREAADALELMQAENGRLSERLKRWEPPITVSAGGTDPQGAAQWRGGQNEPNDH